MADEYGQEVWRSDEAETPQAEAVRRTLAVRVDMLDLSDLTALDALPDEIGIKTFLTSLSLRGTQVGDVEQLSMLTNLTDLDLGGTPFTDVGQLSALTGLTWLDLSYTQITDAGPLSALTGLTALGLSGTQVSDLSFLLSLPEFAAERALSLRFEDTPAADPGRDRRLHMLSLLDGKRCAIETVQYLKGTHPDFRDPPGGALARPLAQRLAEASPLGLVDRDGRIEAENPGDPERLAPKERAVRVQALRAHVAQLREEAEAKQLPADLRARLARYATPLEADEPTFLLLDGPMAFLRGGATDPYVTEALDGGFVEGWRALVAMHDALRPLLMPEELDQPDLPDPAPEATPDAGMAVADDAIAVLEMGRDAGAVGDSVIAAMNAARDYFEAAKSDHVRRPGLVRRGLAAIGGPISLIVNSTGFAASMVTLQLWAATPQGQAVILQLQPILARILALFGG